MDQEAPSPAGVLPDPGPACTPTPSATPPHGPTEVSSPPAAGRSRLMEKRYFAQLAQQQVGGLVVKILTLLRSRSMKLLQLQLVGAASCWGLDGGP